MSLPYFPMYPTDFEAKTSHLTLEEDGAYNRLLRLCWMTPGCSLPDDDAWIMRRMRVDQATFEAVVRFVIDEFFTRANGRVSNARIKKEYERSSEAHSKRVLAGAKGGKAKALKTNETAPSKAKAMPKQPEPEPEPDLSKKEDTNVSLSASTDAGTGSTPMAVNEVSEAVSAYNAAASRHGWPRVATMNQQRIKHLKARLRDVGGLDGWMAALSKAENSDFICGRADKHWTGFGFDALVTASKFTKLMEGNYDNRTGNPNPSNGNRHSGTAEAFLAVGARYAGGGTVGGGYDGF